MRSETNETDNGKLEKQDVTDFDRKALSAADNVLRMWIVRIGCGFISAAMAFQSIETLLQSDQFLLTRILGAIISSFVAVEFAIVAVCGRSIFFLRVLLSGTYAKSAINSRNDAK